MARYTGPKTKIARKFGEAIFGDDKAFEKRNYPPGQHGINKRRGKKSEYAIQLMEKQKAKYTYGILERQFRNMFKKATAAPGITGEVLLQLCESRLDNVVFRMGISPSRRRARQLVSHRHITVNGEVVNIPSYQLKAGDVVAVREKSNHLILLIDHYLVQVTYTNGLLGTLRKKKVLLYQFLQEFKFQKTSTSNSSSNYTLNNN